MFWVITGHNYASVSAAIVDITDTSDIVAVEDALGTSALG